MDISKFHNSLVERNWNTEFQTIIKMPDTIQKYKALSNLSKDFLHASKLYAKIIISELYLPDNKKTVRPVQLGNEASQPCPLQLLT